jgi:4-hydroxy-tetrahydrodipicolinate synthase
MLVGVNVAQPSLEESLDLLAFAGRVGCSHAFVNFPRQLDPESQGEVYAYYRRIIDSTNMGIVLYAYDAPNMRRFHPSGIAVDVFDRLADIDNVIAVKLTQPMNPAVAMELCERLSDRVLVGPASLDMALLLARHYPVQWTGQWIVEGVQSPEKPYAVELLNALVSKRFDEALKMYWRLEPAYRLVHRLQQPLLIKGGHPWAHIRYFQWCVGGNGGLIRDTKHGKDQVSVLDRAGREEIRDTYRKIGITPMMVRRTSSLSADLITRAVCVHPTCRNCHFTGRIPANPIFAAVMLLVEVDLRVIFVERLSLCHGFRLQVILAIRIPKRNVARPGL